MKYTVNSKSSGEHVVEWDDGVSATVKGPWQAAYEAAHGRVAFDELAKAEARIRASVSEMRSCATMLDRAAIDVASVARAATRMVPAPAGGDGT
jgi:hypothetical protein